MEIICFKVNTNYHELVINFKRSNFMNNYMEIICFKVNTNYHELFIN